MKRKSWVRNSLDIGHRPYQETQHEAAFTAEQLARKEHVPSHEVAKVVAVQADGKPVLLVIPGDRRICLDSARDALGAKEVRLLSEAEIEFLFPDCEVGAIPPMRHWEGVDVLMDTALLTEKEIVFAGGSLRDSFRMSFAEWYSLVRPRVGSFSHPSDRPDASTIYEAGKEKAS